MMRVFFEPSAETDLDAIFEHIAQDNPPAALRVVELLRERIMLLGEFPESGRLRPDLAPDIRSFAFDQCSVFYLSQPERVSVVHVAWHGRDVSALFQRNSPESS